MASAQTDRHPFSRGVFWPCLLAALLLAAPLACLAGLPPGQVGLVLTAEQANQELIQQGRATPTTLPFAPGATVYQITAGQTLRFVRFYLNDPSRFKNGSVGGWLMPAAEVRGKSISQVADLFALPQQPDSVVSVSVPTGTVLRSGVAGAIAGWGQGGGQQILLMQYIGLDDYANTRQANQPVLFFTPYVGGGRPGAVAEYLDGLDTPEQYSDLDEVFGRLYFLDAGALRDAMASIGPAAYDSLSFLGTRQSLALGEQLPLLLGRATPKEPGTQSNLRLLAGGGSWQPGHDQPSLNHRLAGASAAFSRPLGLGWQAGVLGGFARGEFSLGDSRGDGSLTTFDLGGFLLRREPAGYWGVSGFLGAGWAKMNRRILFAGLDRTASSYSVGPRAGLSLLGAARLGPCGQHGPAGSASLLWQGFNPGQESGADSLDLNVDDFHTLGLRLRAGWKYQSVPAGNNGGVSLELGLYLTTEIPLTPAEINAGLSGQPGGLAVAGHDRVTHRASPTAALAYATGSISWQLNASAEFGDGMAAGTVGASLAWIF